jgi:hypothetical protein
MSKCACLLSLSLKSSIAFSARPGNIEKTRIQTPQKAIIAAGAVVTKDVPANAVAAGVPAKVRKSVK